MTVATREREIWLARSAAFKNQVIRELRDELPSQKRGTMNDESRGWCVEHDAHEIVSFGTDPRGFCSRGNEIDIGGWYEYDCRIEQLQTRKEWDALTEKNSE